MTLGNMREQGVHPINRGCELERLRAVARHVPMELSVASSSHIALTIQSAARSRRLREVLIAALQNPAFSFAFV
jgi:hypothetical protein